MSRKSRTTNRKPIPKMARPVKTASQKTPPVKTKSKRKTPPSKNRGAAKNPQKTGSGRLTLRGFATGSFYIVGATSRVKSRIDDGDIWIEDGVTGEVETVTVSQADPYQLQPNDIICCYEPGTDPTDPAVEPAVDTFSVDYDDGTTAIEDVITYDYSDDSLEVDLSVLESFEELYDPTPDETYDCTDPSGDPVGIEG